MFFNDLDETLLFFSVFGIKCRVCQEDYANSGICHDKDDKGELQECPKWATLCYFFGTENGIENDII